MTGTSEDIRWPLENQRNSGNSFMTAPEAMVQTCSARPALNTLVEDKRSAADDSDGQIETVYGNAAAAEEPQTTRVSYMPATSPSAVQTQAKTTQQLQQTSSTLTPGPLSSQKPRTHTAAASYSAFPNLPILPSEGLMSGPYPSLRPVSVHEPLQPLPAAVPPASLFPQSNASALDARPSLSAPFPPTGPTAAAISMQHRLSKGSLREPRASPSPQPNRSPQLVGNTGTYFAPQPEASTSRAALNAIPIRRPEPEVCVECMMRGAPQLFTLSHVY